MTALPNHTCFDVLSSFGVELPFEVVYVDVIKFNLPDADTYSRYGVLVNGEHCALLVKLANISGSWKKIGMAKSDAERNALLIDGNATRFIEVRDLLQSGVRLVGKTEVKLGVERISKLIREYNSIIDFFSNYHIMIAKKVRYNYIDKCIELVN